MGKELTCRISCMSFSGEDLVLGESQSESNIFFLPFCLSAISS